MAATQAQQICAGCLKPLDAAFDHIQSDGAQKFHAHCLRKRLNYRNASYTPDPDSKLIGWGWAMTFLFPLAGFIIGIILLTRSRIGHGLGQMATAATMAFVGMVAWAAIATHEVRTNHVTLNREALCSTYQYAKDTGDTQALQGMPSYCHLN